MNKERYKYSPDFQHRSDFGDLLPAEMNINANKSLFLRNRNGYYIQTERNQLCEGVITIDVRYREEGNYEVENVIKLEAGSSMRLVVFHHSASNAKINNKLSVELLDNSRLEIVEIVDTKSSFISTIKVVANKSSVYNSTVLDIDNHYVVRDQLIDLAKNGAECSLNGLYLTDVEEHVDNYIKVHHQVPHCTSNQLYKGILSGRSDAAFTGHILVEKDAQQTAAYQQNHNILLSDFAKINSRPLLEIYADDVKCNHGATVGKLDPEAIYYMRQRGIPFESARRLQLIGFAEDVARLDNFEDIQQLVHQKITHKLALL